MLSTYSGKKQIMASVFFQLATFPRDRRTQICDGHTYLKFHHVNQYTAKKPYHNSKYTLFLLVCISLQLDTAKACFTKKSELVYIVLAP